jgi:hypothetical protein
LPPDVIHELCEIGLPAPFLDFTPAEELRLLGTDTDLLILGTFTDPIGDDGLSQVFCCLSLIDGRVRDCQRGRDLMAVNGSLGLFRETARAVMARFPLNLTRDSPEEADDLVAAELEAIIRSVDPTALDPGYWDEFLWDIRIGDFRE